MRRLVSPEQRLAGARRATKDVAQEVCRRPNFWLRLPAALLAQADGVSNGSQQALILIPCGSQ